MCFCFFLCVRNSLGTGVFTPNLKKQILVWRCLEVPSVNLVDTRQSPLARYFVNLHCTIYRCQMNLVEIVWPKSVGMCWKFWRQVWLVEEITGEFCLQDQVVPLIHRKLIWDPTNNIFQMSLWMFMFFFATFRRCILTSTSAQSIPFASIVFLYPLEILLSEICFFGKMSASLRLLIKFW